MTADRALSGTPGDSCIFCRIIAGEIPAVRVFEDERILAFLDIRPIREGHMQIVPKQHYDYFEDMPEALAAAILALGQRLGRAAKKIYGVRRVGFLFTGGDVAHAHAHVVPMVEATDITSRRYIAEEKLTFRETDLVPPGELRKVADKLRASMAGV